MMIFDNYLYEDEWHGGCGGSSGLSDRASSVVEQKEGNTGTVYYFASAVFHFNLYTAKSYKSEEDALKLLWFDIDLCDKLRKKRKS